MMYSIPVLRFLLAMLHVTGTVLGLGDTVVRKTDIVTVLTELTVYYESG